MACRHKKPPKPKHKRVKKPKKPHPVHARHRAFSLGKSTPASGIGGEPSSGLHPAATGGMAAHDVEVGSGLSAVILNLVGEDVASLAAGLAAWRRERIQEPSVKDSIQQMAVAAQPIVYVTW